MSIGEKLTVGTVIVTGVLTVGSIVYGIVDLTAQVRGNKQMIDLDKTFNFAIDYQDTGTSIVKLDEYSDYVGNTIEFKTQDGLIVTSSLEDGLLLNARSYEEAYNTALLLNGYNEQDIVSYDLLQGLDVTVEDAGWNRNFFPLNYDFYWVLTETPSGVVVENVAVWGDWSEDDKVQYKFSDGRPRFGTYKNITLVNDLKVKDGVDPDKAVYNYALSLAGSEDRLRGDVDTENHKVKRLIPYNQETNQ